MFEISRDPIDTQKVIDAVGHPSDGAIVTFLGKVRDNADNRSVNALEYEAYPEMAIGQMKTIAAEVKQRWGIERMAIVHRVGLLHLEDIAVVIAVASPHRREAFEACLHAIDRIKEIVPIWKKEYYADGTQWKNQ